MKTLTRPPQLSWSLGATLWGVAYLSLAMDVILATPNASGILGLILAGHGLTAVALVIDVKQRCGRGPADALFLTLVLIVVVLMESLGLIVALREGESNQSLWFAVALSFALSGIVASWRGGGSDGAIASQLFFHGVMIIPALAAVGRIANVLVGTIEANQAFNSAGAMAVPFFVVAGSAMAPLFATIMAVLTFELGYHSERKSPLWPTLLAHQAAYLVLAARWAFDGV